MTEPRWKLKVRQLSRWHDLRAFLGWRWEWEVREYLDQGQLTEGYYYPALWPHEYRGRTRYKNDAWYKADQARQRFEAPPPKKSDWLVRYHD